MQRETVLKTGYISSLSELGGCRFISLRAVPRLTTPGSRGLLGYVGAFLNLSSRCVSRKSTLLRALVVLDTSLQSYCCWSVGPGFASLALLVLPALNLVLL